MTVELVVSRQNTSSSFFGPQTVFCTTDKSADKDKHYVGILAHFADDADSQMQALELLYWGCHGLVFVWSGGTGTLPKSLWTDSTCGRQGALNIKVVPCQPIKVIEAVQTLRKELDSVDERVLQFQRDSLMRSIQAAAVYRLISDFSHNSRADITNTLLAPARMLALDSDDGWAKAQSLWENGGADKCCEFKKKVMNAHLANPEEGQLYGAIGFALCDAMANVMNAFYDPNKESAKLATCLQHLMAVMTECRVAAGAKTPPTQKAASSQTASPDVAPIRMGEASGRILVVDDHIEYWRPVLEEVAIKMKNNGSPVEIELSCDAQYIDNDKKILLGPRLPEYDLVLLDIYLGDHNGIDLLKTIRGAIMHLPVLLWTTSMEIELPAEAAQANGFLLKKRATIDDIVRVITVWLDRGSSQRLWSLPSPFFNHTIRTRELRETALAFTKWTLRYMDCFHAVDHFFFRYFNDHGGRHILGVLDTVAKLLRPFLFDETLFKEHSREHTLFCLYIAVLCHEYGMFPIYKTDKGGSNATAIPTEQDWARVDAFRKLHAMRGMLMLLATQKDAKKEHTVSGLWTYLAELDNVVGEEGRAAVALLVGYHQRCFSIAAAERSAYDDAGQLASENTGAIKKICRAADSFPDVPWVKVDDIFKKTADAWESTVRDKEALLRFRKLCAILRFADALDVDHTRIPAEFLLADSDKRRPMQDQEDCKRQVLKAVDIDRGCVTLSFFSVEPSDEVKSILIKYAKKTFKLCERIKRRPDDKESEDLSKLLEDIQNIDFDIIRLCEWHKYYAAPFKRIECADLDKTCEAFLKACLQSYFTCKKVSLILSFLDNEELKQVLAVAAAILVILEIKDEYKAIKETGLTEHIQLSNVIWNTDDTTHHILPIFQRE